MKFIELFAGIGGMGYGLMKAGMECVGFVEWDKYAHKAFKLLHDPDERMWARNDITSVTDDDLRLLGEQHTIELISGGFPCQSFSIAGRREGFADQTRGTLFFEIIRFASILKPKYLLLENVKGLLNHDGGRTYATIICALDELGYDCEWQLLNSKNYVPQNRERIFIVGHLRGSGGRKIFPFGGENGNTVDVVKERILIDDQGRTKKKLNLLHTCPTLRAQTHGNEPKVLVVGNTNPSGNGGMMNGQVFDSNGLAPTLTTNKGEGNKILVPSWIPTPDDISKTLRTGGKGSLTAKHAYDIVAIPVLTPDQNGRRFKEPGDPMFTLTAQDKHGVAITDDQKRKGYRIRKLTPLECFRLQSFPDEWHYTLKEHGISDSQLYKMAGNGVTSAVAYEIGKRLMEVSNENINI